MGAWIEMIRKHGAFMTPAVAPLVGAWIEMTGSAQKTESGAVAPLVGAWIEIAGGLRIVFYQLKSRPSCARGLK